MPKHNDPCECGLSYDPDYPEDKVRHAREHAEYLCGPSIQELQSVQSIGVVAGYQVVRVDSTVPTELRWKIARVAYVAQRSMPEFPAGYDGSMTDENPRLYVIVDGIRAIGMVLVMDTNQCWLLRWCSDGKACLRSMTASYKHRPGVGRIWIAARYRRRSMAQHTCTDRTRCW